MQDLGLQRRSPSVDSRPARWNSSGPGVTAGRENPYEHNGSAVRGGSRSERNMLRAITGGFTSLDRDTLEQLSQLQAA